MNRTDRTMLLLQVIGIATIGLLACAPETKPGEAPRVLDLCVTGGRFCAVLEGGRVACVSSGVIEPFVVDLDAVAVDCYGEMLCAENAHGGVECWMFEGYEAPTFSRDECQPDPAALPFTQWTLNWEMGCGISPAGDAHCWPAAFGVPGTHDYRAKEIAITRACIILIDEFGVLHARHEEENCAYTSGYDYYQETNLLEYLPDGSDWQHVSGGSTHACAWNSLGEVTCWGSVVPTPSERSFIQVDSTTYASCGVTVDSTIECWKWDHFDGEPYDSDLAGWGDVLRWIPDAVPTSSGWVQVQTSADFACALNEDGEVHCFGAEVPQGSLWEALLNPVDEVPCSPILGPCE